MNTQVITRIAVCILLALTPGLLIAQDDIQTRTVKFAPGKSSATINSSLKGRQTIDYVVSASEGQEMKVTLKTNKGSNYFNILPPGSAGEAIFIGSTEGNSYSGTLSAGGDYKIRVYLMSSAARRNESAKFTLTISVTGGSNAKQGDATVAGTPYNAMGQVPAARGDGSKGSLQADFAVIRKNDGSADVRVNLPGGNTHQLRFAQGEWTCLSAKCKLSYKRPGGDEWEVIVNGTERFFIPDAVITGG